MSPTSRYDAFISYSHRSDGVLGPALQVGLEHFAAGIEGLLQAVAAPAARDQLGEKPPGIIVGHAESVAKPWRAILPENGILFQ